jgi:hypothetical protein
MVPNLNCKMNRKDFIKTSAFAVLGPSTIGKVSATIFEDIQNPQNRTLETQPMT